MGKQENLGETLTWSPKNYETDQAEAIPSRAAQTRENSKAENPWDN